MLSIILPCFNPQEKWEHTVASAYEQISSLIPDDIEIILINDGSTKTISVDSLEYLKNRIPLFRYISYSNNKGKGFAIREGVKACKGSYVIYTDIDFPYENQCLVGVYQSLVDGNDVVIGVKDRSYYKNVPFIRKLISKILRRLIRFSLSMPISDTQCGLKGFKAVHKSIFLQTKIDRYLFDLEFVYAVSSHKPPLKIVPIEIALKPGIIFRKMNAKIVFKEFRNFLTIVFKGKF